MASLIKESQRPRKPWRVDWADRRRRRTRRFETKREAEQFIGDIAGGRRAADASRSSLSDWLVEWVQTHGPEWEPRTRRDRATYADRLIVPGLGALRLHEIGRVDVRQWRQELLRAGSSPHVVNRAASILSAALGAAVSDEILAANPCRGLRRLPEGPQRRTPATLSEVEGIRALVPTPRDRAIISLLAYAGLRPSELVSLAWLDVRDATIVVRSAGGARGADKGTKSGSVRSVTIIPPLHDDLEALERPGPLVAGSRLDYPNWRGRTWRPARVEVGATVTPYDLRHTFASLLIAEGRTPHDVARQLGHSTPALTLSTYGHLFDEAQLRDGESMAEAAARARHDASI